MAEHMRILRLPVYSVRGFTLNTSIHLSSPSCTIEKERRAEMNKRKNEVIEIPAKPVETDQPVKRQLRVAAYCRVSTSQESQQNSYQAQKAYYTDKIASNPDWCLAGIFADDTVILGLN